VAELLERAQRLVAAGPYSPSISEIIDVHALLYPSRDPVCDHCPAEQGRAYFAIKRWVEQQENSFSTSISSIVKKGTTARVHSDTLTYTPHGLGVAYTNANLTDKAARDILKMDPDAIQHFAVLPPEAEEGEDEQPLTSTQQATETQVAKAEQQATAAPAEFDYAKLARAMLDEVERRQAAADAAASQARIDAAQQQPALTASTGGAADAGQGSDNVDNTDTNADTSDSTSESDQDEAKPVSLSRANKSQLTAFYVAEIGHAPAEDLTVDALRGAIAEHRAGQQDPE
jgi:hypothetical protein